jgi:AraC-like DNA-binding protein
MMAPGLAVPAVRSPQPASGAAPRRIRPDAVKTRWLFQSPSVSLHSWICPQANQAAGEEGCQEHFEIAILLHGVFRYIGPRGHAICDANSALCFNAFEPYQTSHPAGAGDAGLSLVVAPAALADLLQRYAPRELERHRARFPRLAVALSSKAQLLLALLRKRLLAAGEVDDFVVEETMLHLLSRLWSDGAGPSPAPSPGTRPRPRAAEDRRQRVDQVKAVLAIEFRNALSIGEIARRVAVSPQHLCRLFKLETGMALHRYLNRLRLRAALAELLDSSRDLAWIGLDAGFSSHSHFTSAYRREFGLTPSATRRLARERCGSWPIGPEQGSEGS